MSDNYRDPSEHKCITTSYNINYCIHTVTWDYPMPWLF